MALDLLYTDVDATWIVSMLAEECPELVALGYDEDRCSLPLDAADYEIPRGLQVTVAGRVFRLAVTAIPVTEDTPTPESNT